MYGEDVVTQGRRTPKLLAQTENTRLESLIGEDAATCFSVDRLTVTSGSAVLNEGAGVHIVSKGQGVVRCGDFTHAVRQGDDFFLPMAAAGETAAEGSLELSICRGGE